MPEPIYSYLGPAGTFTWTALDQVPGAAPERRRAVNNVGEALDDVVAGRATAAMIAIENSIEGGVTAAQDALASVPGLRIIGEHLVPVDFVLVARPGVALADVRVVAAHPVAYAQTHRWLDRALPGHEHLNSTSNVAAPQLLLEEMRVDAAIAPPGIDQILPVEVLAEGIADNRAAVTRFVLVSASRAIPERTGADKTSLVVELPHDRPGGLVEMLEQFATRGVNLSLLTSRPIGDTLGRYRFVIDIDGHIRDERVADALLGLKRFSPSVTYLGSYPRADKQNVTAAARYDDDVFIDARDWLRGILAEEPDAGRV
jgi:prephenate dehydratase